MVDAVRRARSSCGTCAKIRDCVPLARVWAELDGGSYKIRLLDDAPPYRRDITPDSAMELWNPRTYIGRLWAGVERDLARLASHGQSRKNSRPPADGKHLLAFLKEDEAIGPTLAPGQVGRGREDPTRQGQRRTPRPPRRSRSRIA